jgi:hypothetical protein
MLRVLLVSSEVCLPSQIFHHLCSPKAFDLWKEITTNSSVSPDIITVTDVIATLTRSDGDSHMEEVDQVFRNAVDRRLVLRNNNLDSFWEVDLSGMSLPVARAACRFVLHRIRDSLDDDEEREITLITGVGVAQQSKQQTRKDTTTAASTGLREYVRNCLRRDFDPPIESNVPTRAQGTVCIPKENLRRWADRQNKPRLNANI